MLGTKERNIYETTKVQELLVEVLCKIRIESRKSSETLITSKHV